VAGGVSLAEWLRLVFSRAYADTHAQANRQGIAAALAIGVITALITGWAASGVGEHFNIQIALFSAIAAPIAVAILFYIGNLLLAPYRAYADVYRHLQAALRSTNLEIVHDPTGCSRCSEYLPPGDYILRIGLRSGTVQDDVEVIVELDPDEWKTQTLKPTPPAVSPFRVRPSAKHQDHVNFIFRDRKADVMVLHAIGGQVPIARQEYAVTVTARSTTTQSVARYRLKRGSHSEPPAMTPQ